MISTYDGKEILLRATKEQSLDAPLTKNELLFDQKLDKNFWTASLHVCQTNTEFFIDNKRILSWRSKVNKATQTVLAESLCTRVLYLSHHSPTSGHPGERCMYDKFRQNYYWPHMAYNIYVSVTQCLSCAGKNSIQTQTTTQAIPVMQTSKICSNGYSGTLSENHTGNAILYCDDQQIL